MSLPDDKNPGKYGQRHMRHDMANTCRHEIWGAQEEKLGNPPDPGREPAAIRSP
jgi:hypothetical protein